MAVVAGSLNLHPVQAIAASECVCAREGLRELRGLWGGCAVELWPCVGKLLMAAGSQVHLCNDAVVREAFIGRLKCIFKRTRAGYCTPTPTMSPSLPPPFPPPCSLRASPAASEAIAAGKLLTPAGTLPVYVLLHTRVTPATLELRCKTADPGLTSAMLAGIAAKLK